MKIKLGKKYRDSLTGFEGTATGIFTYLYGCVRILLERADKDGKPEEATFDEQRLTEVTGKLVAPTATSGGPRPTPNRGDRA